ncbi:unnamed protein product, partial [Prorocentrum cordatum]
VRSDNYMAYNRPFALAAWFEKTRPKEAYVMYVDPDMIFVQPLLYHLPSSDVRATEGHPVAQHYSYITANAGATDPGWHDFAVPELCGPDCRSLADAQTRGLTSGALRWGPPSSCTAAIGPSCSQPGPTTRSSSAAAATCTRPRGSRR